MSFEYGNQISKTNVITYDKLVEGITDEKVKQRIKSVFDAFNTNQAEGSENGLDFDEQMALLDFYRNADSAGDGNKSISRKELRKAKKQAGQDQQNIKYKAYQEFMQAYNNVMKNETEKSTVEIEKDHSSTVTTKEGEGLTQEIYNRGEDGTYTLKSTSVTDKNGTTFTKREDGLYDSNLQDDAYKYRLVQGEDGTQTFEKVLIDSQGRITEEPVDGKTFRYKYPDDSDGNAAPNMITVYEPDENGESNGVAYKRQKDGHYVKTGIFNKNGGLVQLLPKDEQKTYNYDPATHTFTEEKPVIEEKTYQRKAEIKSKTQRLYVNYDAETRGDWKKASVSSNDKLKDINTSSFVTAEQAMESFLATLNPEKTVNKDKLLADFIKYNPSVFDANSGDVWENADWSKLDFPKNLQRYYDN